MLESETKENVSRGEAVEEEPGVEVIKKTDVTGLMPNGIIWGLPDWWLEQIDSWDTDFLAIREVDNHIEIGPAQVNFIR